MSRVLVTIHGTGRTACNFGIPQTQAIAEHLGSEPHHHAVWWGDIIDAGARISKISDWVNARLHRLALRWMGRPAIHTPRLVSRAADVLHRLIDSIAGVVVYIIPNRKRELIRNRLRDTLAELTRRDHEIVLVSESLGCLVAFDVLRADAHRYNIAAWFTLGSPMRTLVRTGQRRADLGAINRHTVKQWFNLYAPRDLVAAPIASLFPSYPICDERLDGVQGRLQSHRYWADPRVAASIARVLRQNS